MTTHAGESMARWDWGCVCPRRLARSLTDWSPRLARLPNPRDPQPRPVGSELARAVVVTGGAPRALALHGRAWARACVVVQSGLRPPSAVLFYSVGRFVSGRGGPCEWLEMAEPGPSLRRSRCWGRQRIHAGLLEHPRWASSSCPLSTNVEVGLCAREGALLQKIAR